MTDEDDRRQRAKQYWSPTLRVGGSVINHNRRVSAIRLQLTRGAYVKMNATLIMSTSITENDVH